MIRGVSNNDIVWRTAEYFGGECVPINSQDWNCRGHEYCCIGAVSGNDLYDSTSTFAQQRHEEVGKASMGMCQGHDESFNGLESISRKYLVPMSNEANFVVGVSLVNGCFAWKFIFNPNGDLIATGAKGTTYT